MTLRLAHAGWELRLDPELGGSVTAFARHGVDIFRPARPGADHPLLTGCFPLVPYANRIADGRFHVAGQDYALPRNVADQAHPLHGVGWLGEWQVVEADGAGATLRHGHDGGRDWPFAYVAEQHVVLADDGLHMTLSIASRDPRPMPVSLGFHPYFLTQGVTGLRFAAHSLWMTGADLLPTEEVAPDRLGDWSAGAGVRRDDLVDNSYAGWSGEATIARDGGDLRLTGGGTPVLHLFLPPGPGFFCVEPTTAIPDAVNRPAPDMLAPGETRTIRMAVTEA